jgi:hypothetical protein
MPLPVGPVDPVFLHGRFVPDFTAGFSEDAADKLRIVPIENLILEGTGSLLLYHRQNWFLNSCDNFMDAPLEKEIYIVGETICRLLYGQYALLLIGTVALVSLDRAPTHERVPLRVELLSPIVALMQLGVPLG